MRPPTILLTLSLCLALVVTGSLPHAQQLAAAEQVRQLSLLVQRQKALAQADETAPAIPASDAQKLAAALERLQLELNAGTPAGEATLRAAAGAICPLASNVITRLEQGLAQMAGDDPTLRERAAAVRPDIDRVAAALSHLCDTLAETTRPAAERSTDVQAQLNALLAGSEPQVTGLNFGLAATGRPVLMVQPEAGEPDASPADPAPPGPADLAETMEIQFTDDIRQLATDLHHDPGRIVDYVRNVTHYEPYRGSLRGAQETLWESQGNDADISSLALALLRVSNVPSRYISGTVQIPIAQAVNLVGMNSTQRAIDLYNEWGLLQSVVDQPPTAVRLNMVWARAYVNGQWRSLAPWFKQHSFPNRPDLFGRLNLDDANLLTPIVNSATVTQTNGIKAFTGADAGLAADLYSGITTELEQYMACCANTAASKGLAAVWGEPEIVPASNQLGVEPFTRAGPEIEFSQPPITLRHQLQFSLGSIQQSFFAPTLVGKRLVLGYLPATDADWEVLRQYGSIFNLPVPQMLNVKPHLWIDGTDVAQGDSYILGFLNDLDITYRAPGRPVQTIRNRLDAGSWHALTLDPGHTSAQLVQLHAVRLQAMQAAQQINPNAVPIQDAIGQLLQVNGALFFANLNASGRQAAAARNVVQVSAASLGRFSANLSVTRLFVIPIDVDPGGLGADVGLVTSGVYSRVGEAQAERDAFVTWGAVGSGFEHMTHELLYGGNGASTMRVLSEANRQGIPIYAIDQGNLDQSLAQLSINSVYKDIIRNQVLTEHATVYVPQRYVQYEGFNGIGWAAILPNGAGHYLLAQALGAAQLNGILVVVIMSMIGLLAGLIPATAWLAGVIMALTFLLGWFGPSGPIPTAISRAFAALGLILGLVAMVNGVAALNIILLSFIVGVLIPVALALWKTQIDHLVTQYTNLLQHLLHQLFSSFPRSPALVGQWSDPFDSAELLGAANGVQTANGRLELSRWVAQSRGQPYRKYPGLQAMLAAPDGALYAGAGDGHLIRIANPGAPSPTVQDLGKVQPGSDQVAGLVWGSDGNLYAGLGRSGAVLARYRPQNGSFDIAFQPPATTAGKTSLVQALATGGGRIYGGTTPDGGLFWYRPSDNSSGGISPLLANARGVTALAWAGNRLYAGVALFDGSAKAHLVRFDPATGQPTDLGEPFPGETEIGALAAGNDGMIYGGTAPSGIFFRLNPANGQSTELVRLGGLQTTAITDLAVDPSGRLYGGTLPGARLFVYTPTSGVAMLGPTGDRLSITHLTSWRNGVAVAGGPQGDLFILEPGAVAQSGSASSVPIRPAWLTSWRQLTFDRQTPAGTSLVVSVLDPCTEAVLVNNASSGANLSALSTACPSLVLRATLTGGSASPVLDRWSLTWRSQAPFNVYLPAGTVSRQ